MTMQLVKEGGKWKVESSNTGLSRPDSSAYRMKVLYA
jgi:hypothetical protein